MVYLRRIILSVLLLCGALSGLVCQDLEYLVPVISKNAVNDTNTSLILTTGNDNAGYATQQKIPYTNSLQVIDANQPWPPRWYTATPVYTAEMFVKDSSMGLSRFDWIVDAEVVNGYLSFYKLLSHPLIQDGPLQNVELAGYMMLNDKMHCVDTIKTDTGAENMFYRSISVNSKGEKLVGLKKDTHLDLRKYSQNPADSSVHCEIDIIEILDAKGKVIFYWNPVEHLDPRFFRFKETLAGRAFGYGNTDIIQWTRLTNAQWDNDGNILYSLLLYGVGKISRTDGHVMWQINLNQMPIVSGRDTIQWYRQHDFKFLYQTDSSSVYSVYSDGLRNRSGGDSIRTCAVVFELNNNTSKVKVLQYHYPGSKFVADGQGGYDYNRETGDYVMSYGNLKVPISPGKEFTENFEYGKGDSVYGVYEFPQHIHCFRVHRLENFNRPPRPVIVKNGDELQVSGDMTDFTWYRLSGPHLTKVEKAGTGRTIKFEKGCTYCVAGKYGIGYSVSLPFATEKGKHLPLMFVIVLGCLFAGIIGIKIFRPAKA